MPSNYKAMIILYLSNWISSSFGYKLFGYFSQIRSLDIPNKVYVNFILE